MAVDGKLQEKKSARSPKHYRMLSFGHELAREKSQVPVGVFLLSITEVL